MQGREMVVGGSVEKYLGCERATGKGRARRKKGRGG